MIALAAVTFLAYQPAWNGGVLWDDNGHITTPELRSFHGLYRIWFELGASQQYYPVLHSAFWLEHRLWGDAVLGYHLVNIIQHLVAAVLVFCILRYLEVPGAHFAAAVFALHPVHVESVAWITEQKNTLSAVFYLGAMLSYLTFDRRRGKTYYALALGMFVLALLSKSVTATLPAALLVIFWWRRGRIKWRTDVLPLVPFFLLAAGAGTLTAWVERAFIGAEGTAYELTIVQRFLIAGRVVWFYLGKLLCPAELIFIYPRWNVSPSIAWQWLFPVGAIAALISLGILSRRTRAPLAAALLFGGTLFPVLGFLNVYPFRYSFVADHFQYLASVAVIGLAAAGATLAIERRPGWIRIAGGSGCVAVLFLLAALTWLQSRMYTDIETLYRTTIDRNPECGMAYNNLGIYFNENGRFEEAIACYQKALKIDPGDDFAHRNFGIVLVTMGDIEAAVDHYQEALKISPRDAETHYSLGLALARRGSTEEAIAHYQTALEIRPQCAKTHNAMGNVLARAGDARMALAHYRQALAINPNFAEAYNNLGNLLVRCGEIDSAMAHYQRALAINPDYADAHCNLGNALAYRGQVKAALDHFEKALALAIAQNNANLVQIVRGRIKTL